MQILPGLLFKLVLVALLMTENAGDLRMERKRAGLTDKVRDKRVREASEIPENVMAEPSNSCFIPHASSLMNKPIF